MLRNCYNKGTQRDKGGNALKRQGRRKGRLGAWVLALAMVVPCFGALSVLSQTVAPEQTTAQAAEDYSVIRVGITLNGTQTSVPFVLSGKYKLVENTGIALPNGNYTVSASGSTLTIKTPTASYKIGSRITLSEDTTAGVNLISIHTKWNDKNNPSERLSYRGDIVFYAENGAVKVMNRVSMETYTLGVIKGEMGAGFRLEALKAQCVAARSYAIYKMKRSNKVNYDIGDSSTEQVYRGYSSSAILQQAVNETKGQVLTYNGSIIEAMYSAVNGGQTDVPSGNTGFPYFKIRDDSYDLTFKGNEQLLFVPTNIVGTRYDANVHATQVKCTGENVRIRTEPSTAGGNATVIAMAQPGDIFTLVETQNGWYKIKYNGRDAYISADHSEKVISGTGTVSLPYEYDQLHMQDLQKLAYEYLKAKGYNVPTQTNVRLLRCNYLKGKEKFYPNLASRCYKTGEASLKVQYVDGEGKLHDNIDNVVVTVLLQESLSNRKHAYFKEDYRMRGAEAGTESGISG